MSKDVYTMVMNELAAREAYKHETYAPGFITSFGVHLFNQRNRSKDGKLQPVYYDGMRLPNMRLHTLFVAPAGYMKSYYMSQFGNPQSGIFSGGPFKFGSELSMTAAAFAGTIGPGGEKIKGAAEDYSDGFMMIDEFKALTSALKAAHSTDFDAILLAALDHGLVSKRLAYDGFAFTTEMTMWGGVQPASYDLSSGLGRRMYYQLFIPTEEDNILLGDAVIRSRNMKPNKVTLGAIYDACDELRHECKSLKRITFGDDIHKMYRELKLFSYEYSYFDRILIGYHLMKYGPDSDHTMHIDVRDKELLSIINNQRNWRREISMGVDYKLMLDLISEIGNDASIFQIAEAASMYSMSIVQVNKLIQDMLKHEMITRSKAGGYRPS